MTIKEIGFFIRSIREDKGLTQKAFEQEGIVSAPTLSRIELGDTSGSIGSYIAILEKLGYELDIVKTAPAVGVETMQL